MNFKGLVLGTLALMFSTVADATVTELKASDSLPDMVKDYDFAIISFYKPSDPASVEMDSYFDGAKEDFDARVTDGRTSPRKVVWFRVDIEKFPEMAAKPNESCQLIMNKHEQKLL